MDTQAINLQPTALVRKWDTKRIEVYKNSIESHISFLETSSKNTAAATAESIKQAEINLQRFNNYKDELEKILKIRKQIT